MKPLFLLFIFPLFFAACKLMPKEETARPNEQFNKMLHNYYEERMKLFPLEATANGDNRYNDLLPVDFTDGYRDTLRNFFNGFLDSVKTYNRESLNSNDRISYDIFKREMEMSIERLHFHDNYMPVNQ